MYLGQIKNNIGTAPRQGQVTVSVKFDNEGAKELALNSGGLFPKGETKKVHTLHANGIQFFDVERNKKSKVPLAKASFNGDGAEELEAANGDVDLALRMLKNKHILGFVSQERVEIDSDESKEKFSSVSGGRTFVYFDEVAGMVPGMLMEADIPDPRKESSTYTRHRMNYAPGTYPIIAKPFNATSFANFHLQDIRALLKPQNISKWKEGMGKDLPQTAASFNAANYEVRRVVGCVLYGLEWFLKNGWISFDQRKCPELFARPGSPELTPTEQVARIFQFCKMTKKNDAQAQTQLNERGKAGDYELLFYNLANVCFYDGSNLYYEFGSYIDNAGERVHLGRDKSTMKIASNVIGELVENHINQTPKAYAALGQRWNDRTKYILGKATKKPGKPGIGEIQMGFKL